MEGGIVDERLIREAYGETNELIAIFVAAVKSAKQK